tara:strand:- start:612 stop:1220 length:609 start_codon:yes stop_codon:yes gene_type:complete
VARQGAALEQLLEAAVSQRDPTAMRRLAAMLRHGSGGSSIRSGGGSCSSSSSGGEARRGNTSGATPVTAAAHDVQIRRGVDGSFGFALSDLTYGDGAGAGGGDGPSGNYGGTAGGVDSSSGNGASSSLAPASAASSASPPDCNRVTRLQRGGAAEVAGLRLLDKVVAVDGAVVPPGGSVMGLGLLGALPEVRLSVERPWIDL